MQKIRTKEAAESALRELPSVLGAFVREDIHGHPREVHILIGPAPNARDLARDVRSLLEERLGLRIDQRIISIAQLVRPLDPAGDEAAVGRAEALSAAGPATPSAPVTSAAPAAPAAPSALGPSAAPAMSSVTVTSVAPTAPEAPTAHAIDPRLVLERIESHAVDGRVRVSVQLGIGGRSFEGEWGELDGGGGRLRAAAKATLAAVMEASGGSLQLETTSARSVRALGREYAVIGVVAGSERLGRRLRPLFGAHPVDFGGAALEDAAALATLHAVNRVAAAHTSLVTRQRRA